MKRIGVVCGIVTAVVLANLCWIGLERRAGTRRMENRMEARRPHARASSTSERVKITQFYTTSAVITDANHSTICYGVENARAVRLEPPVEQLTPALTRCFWVEPKRDTTYSLIAEGFDGSTVSAGFRVRVTPAPPTILFIALSDDDVRRGEPVTICYGVERASSVRLDPLGWALAALRKNCVRMFPPRTTDYTLIASGAAGLTDRDRFRIKVR